MIRVLLEHFVIVGSVVMLMLINCSMARPRRRFCEHFPFSRICLGVAAKRSAQRFDLSNRQKSSEILSTMIRRLLEEERSRAERESQMTIQDKSDLYDETPFLEQLETMVRNKNHRPIDQTSYIGDDPEWAENYDNSKGQL